MTEERMLEVAGSYSRQSWYSGLCSVCGDEFYTGDKKAKVCSWKCNLPTPGAEGRGRCKNDAGYIICSGQQTHPRSSGGNMAEHILVMEKHLGRYLMKGETVHHKNGIRDDNRIDNLELWVKWQTPGQRVDDLLNFVAKNYPEEIRTRLNSLLGST